MTISENNFKHDFAKDIAGNFNSQAIASFYLARAF